MKRNRASKGSPVQQQDLRQILLPQITVQSSSFCLHRSEFSFFTSVSSHVRSDEIILSPESAAYNFIHLLTGNSHRMKDDDYRISLYSVCMDMHSKTSKKENLDILLPQKFPVYQLNTAIRLFMFLPITAKSFPRIVYFFISSL